MFTATQVPYSFLSSESKYALYQSSVTFPFIFNDQNLRREIICPYHRRMKSVHLDTDTILASLAIPEPVV